MSYRVKIPATIRTDSLDKLGDSVVNLSKWCEDELNEVASQFQSTEPDFIWNSVPPKPRRGTYAYADGTNWNPGYGEGPYFYNGKVWVPLRTAPEMFRNRIINGGMMISQENGSTAVSSNGTYPVDQFGVGVNGTTGTFTAQQIATPGTPGGSPNYLKVTVTAADAAVAAGDLLYLFQRIEGLRCADLLFGTAGAKAVTLQFSAISNIAGTYCVVLSNSGASRSYVAEYNISAGEAGTIVTRSITIPGDTAGTWLKDTSLGIEVRWGLMVGATFQQAAGSWGTGNVVGSANQVNFMAANGNNFSLFDVSLTIGPATLPFQLPDYTTELRLCQRYWQSLQYQIISMVFTAAQTAYVTVPYITQMRAAPTVTQTIAPTTFNLSGLTFSSQIATDRIRFDLSSTGAGVGYAQNGVYSLNARL